jgi:hypothetical protein
MYCMNAGIACRLVLDEDGVGKTRWEEVGRERHTRCNVCKENDGPLHSHVQRCSHTRSHCCAWREVSRAGALVLSCFPLPPVHRFPLPGVLRTRHFPHERCIHSNSNLRFQLGLLCCPLSSLVNCPLSVSSLLAHCPCLLSLPTVLAHCLAPYKDPSRAERIE